MSRDKFMALVAEGTNEGYSVSSRTLAPDQLAKEEVLVEVLYSSLNYKDALALTGRGKVIRKFPMVCGIDLAGRVLESSSPEVRPGDEVLAVGQGLGETRWGGFSQLARVPADIIVRVPSGLTAKQTMMIGTAGFTAMLSLMALEHNGVKPDGGPLLVTGAAGGVGSLALALLSGRGYKVIAATGRSSLREYLFRLGANEIIERAELEQKNPPLARERWAAAVDTVGGQILASVIAATASYGSVAACGMAGGANLATTVFPFILRNVSLLGINSVTTPKPTRLLAWERLAGELSAEKLEVIADCTPMSTIMERSEELLTGSTRGRIVVDVNL
jgi:acrylyl-CoA reductase (NADPH)